MEILVDSSAGIELKARGESPKQAHTHASVQFHGFFRALPSPQLRRPCAVDETTPLFPAQGPAGAVHKLAELPAGFELFVSEPEGRGFTSVIDAGVGLQSALEENRSLLLIGGRIRGAREGGLDVGCLRPALTFWAWAGSLSPQPAALLLTTTPRPRRAPRHPTLPRQAPAPRASAPSGAPSSGSPSPPTRASAPSLRSSPPPLPPARPSSRTLTAGARPGSACSRSTGPAARRRSRRSSRRGASGISLGSQGRHLRSLGGSRVRGARK